MGLTQVSKDGVKNDAIDASKLPANSVGASELADNAVDTNAIADQAVALSKLPHGDGSSNGKFLRANNGADPSFESIPAGTTINNNADNRVITGSNSANTLNAESNVIIDSSGNVGIGVSPSRKLHVSGDILGNAFMLAANTSPSPSIQTQIYRVADNTLAFATNGSNERMRIDSSGRVGIGNDTSNFLSTSKLIVGSGSGDQGLTIYSGNSNNAFIHFADGTSGADKYRGYFEYAHGDNSIRVGVNDTERLRLLSSGGLTFNGDTAAANALDDYEEGSWSANNLNYDYDGNQAQRGHYIKIGRIVHAFFRVKFHNQSTYTGQHLRFTGLPFTSADGNPYDVNVGAVAHGYGSVDLFRIYVQPNTTYAYWYTPTGNNYNNSTNLNGQDMRGCITYTASS